MSSSRNTPTPSVLNEDRPLTQADLNEYYKFFDEAREHRPESPTLPPSPPDSYTGPSPSSSSSSRKRKRDEDTSMELDPSPSKRPHRLEYHIPPRIRRGAIRNTGETSTKHHNLGRDFKRLGDAEELKRPRESEDFVKSMLVHAHLYAKGILNFAFGYTLRSDADWMGLRHLLDITIERFNRVFLNTHDERLEIWLAYLQYLKLACEIQHDRQRITKFRNELSGIIKQAEQQPTAAAQAQVQAGGASGSTIAKSPSNLDVLAATSHPSTPLPASVDPKKDPGPAPKYTWDMVHSKELARLLGHTLLGPHNGDSRRKVMKLLNPASLRAHFPRTFMRAFGEHGVGHASYPMADDAASSSQGQGRENISPLEPWEEAEIHDLEMNEREGGDFPYPHHPQDIVWVVVLGRSLLSDLDLPETL